MKKKLIFIGFFLISIILLGLTIPALHNNGQQQYLSLNFPFENHSNDSLNINSIVPKDDAFHGTTTFPSVEWWYFDSMLSQNYSVHIGFKVFTYYGINLLKPSLNIYHQEQLIYNETILLPPGSFSVSEEYPRIEIRNKPVVLFDKSRYDQTGEWVYQVSYMLNDIGINLTFTGETKGWYYKTLHEGWTVAIPQGTVEGMLYFPDEQIPVNGRGYHDHNWNFSLKTPARGWSWFWGKITGETLNLAWAEIKETGILEQTFTEKLGVLNTQNNCYVVIDPDNITFTAKSYIFRDKRFIPTEFHIKIEQDDVFIDVILNAKSIHRSNPSVMTMHYWRYFVLVDGVISYGDRVEKIDNKIQIMEYMRFI